MSERERGDINLQPLYSSCLASDGHSTETNQLENMNTRIQADLEAARGDGWSCLIGDVARVQQEAQQLVR